MSPEDRQALDAILDEANTKTDGFNKYDDEKPAWHLVPWAEMEHVVKAMMTGSAKYEDHLYVEERNWLLCEEPDRYFNSVVRHILAWRRGNTEDKDSGLPPLAHAVCCLLILMDLDRQDEEGTCG